MQIHGGAFNVPAGAARAPGAFPGGFAGLGALPEGKVHRIFFEVADFDARTGLHFFNPAAREATIIRIMGDAEVDIAARGISIAAVNEALHHADNLIHLLGGAGVQGDRQDV